MKTTGSRTPAQGAVASSAGVAPGKATRTGRLGRQGGAAGEAGSILSPWELGEANRLNPGYHAELGFDPEAFGGGTLLDSADFAEAVARFQQARGLPVDGIAGPVTCAELDLTERPGPSSAHLEAGPSVAADAQGDPPQQVQRKRAESSDGDAGSGTGAAGDDAPAAIQAAAERGLEAPSSALPFLDEIQASFGDAHDLADVPAHIGGAATAAAGAMGATAYAAGGQVAFAAQPDLHTAAHEAAHVVQQRAGVQLDGGVGDEGDVYERQADAVADAVVAGRSAAPLLGPAAPGAATGAVQRRKNKNTKASAPSLPDGVNHQILGTSGRQVVRTSWYMDGAETSGDRVSNPPKMEALNRELKQIFWWMTDEQVAASRDFSINGPLPEPFFVVGNTTGTFRVFGLPPGTDIVWKSEGGGAVSLTLSLRVAGLEQPPDLPAEFEITYELRQRIDDQFERTFGLKPEYTMLTAEHLKVRPKKWAWVFEYSEQQVVDHAGEAWKRLKKPEPSDPTTDDSSPFGGQVFPNYIPIEDREYFLAWMEEALGKPVASGGAGQVEIDADLIRQMKRLDEDPLLKEQVLDRMRRGHTGSGFVVDARSFRRLIHETREDAERIRLGLAPAPEPTSAPTAEPGKPFTSPRDVETAPKTRFFERPIYGHIVNLGSMASVGKTMDMYFQTEDRQGLGFVGVNIDWYATPVGEPSKHVRKGHTFHYAHHDAAKWSVSFAEPGRYEITAFVDHQSYWPTSFKTFVEVKTEDERLAEVEQHAFGGFDAETSVTDPSHFFEVSFTNDRFGPNKYTFGKVREGEVPEGWDPQTLDERLAFMQRDAASLEDLIERYKDRKDRASKDIVEYARHALETKKSTEARIRADAVDLTPIEIRGAFLSEKNGVRSGDLNLVGLAGSRHKSFRLDGEEVAWDQPTVRIHDMSQLYEPKNAVYTGEGADFRSSAEKAFIELCKSYPPGRVSVLMEGVDGAGKRTGKTLGFELHTGTAWKDAKEVVWDSKVQVVVNVAAAAVTIFVPGAAVVTMALVTAYNAVDVVDNLASLHRKGQATWKDGVEAGVMIGLDLVPFLGEMKAVGKLGKSTLFALDAAQVSTAVIVLTDQGLEQVRGLRDQHVLEIARLQQEIESLRAVNDSDPRIAAKERELKERIAEAQAVSAEVFSEMAKSGAVMLMAPLAFNHMLRSFAKGSAADLANSDLFVEQKGVKPYYDADTGKIRGDSSMLTPESMTKLQEAWALDVYAQHADAANLLGVRTEEVVIKRDAGVSTTRLVKNDQGIWEVTAPAKRKHADVLDDVWRERQKLPDAPEERPKGLERGSYEPTFSANDILAVGKPVVVGHRLESRGEADEIMRGLAEGNRKALERLGVRVPKGFDPRTVEWGLGVLPDGKFVIVRGDHGAVDWSPFPELRPLAHSHPLRASNFLKPDGGPVGVHVADMVKGGGANELNRVSFFPSAADIGFCVRNALSTHTVHTPYVHKGKGMVGNPVRDFASLPRIDIEITGAQRIGAWEGIEHIPAYQAHLVVRDVTGTVLWEGDMIAVHHPSVGSLLQFGPAPAHWLRPGAGGGTSGGASPAPVRAPRNEVEELALADWQALEKSGKNYAGKYDSDIWYDRYNEGLRYDLDKNHWYRPDGRKVRDPQKFDSKSWTKKKVYEHLAGKDSTSSFKSYAEMLIDEGIATRAKIEKRIEQIGFLGRDEDMVRHELKVAYHDEVLAAMMKPPTPEARFEAMRRITTRLDSADKGNLTEDWYKEAILGGRGDARVAARKDTLREDQGIELEKNRFIDIVDGNLGREIKSGEGVLSDVDIAQMQDYARMVDGQAVVRTSSGTAQIRHVRYTFTSPRGAKANVATMRWAFNDGRVANRISFELFTPRGKVVIIRSPEQLDAQRWLFE